LRLFKNRTEAGNILSEELIKYSGNSNVVCIGLIRGGVSIAKAVGEKLSLHSYGFIVQKIGAPGNPELAIGAITEKDRAYLNKDIVAALCLTDEELSFCIDRAKQKYLEKSAYYNINFNLEIVKNRIVILCDDGIATGASMICACKTIRKYMPEKLIAASPVSSKEAECNLKKHANSVICLNVPGNFLSVSNWYEDFSEVSKNLVKHTLNPECVQAALR
jgi:predicted phosphoribosyltransferase